MKIFKHITSISIWPLKYRQKKVDTLHKQDEGDNFSLKLSPIKIVNLEMENLPFFFGT